MGDSKTPKSDEIRALREKAFEAKSRTIPRGMRPAPPIEGTPDPTTRWRLDEDKGHLVVDKPVAKKRGRPATRTPEDRKAFRAELMRKRRKKATP